MKNTYNLDNCTILPVLQMALSTGLINNLKVTDSGLSIAEPGLIAQIQAIFGDGPYGSKTIADYLASHKEQLFAETRAYVMCRQKIADISKLVIQLCEAAWQPPIDIGAAVFADWMLYLPDCTKQQSIEDLLLPGTHCSAMYKVSLHDPIVQAGLEGLSVWSHVLNVLPVSALVNSWELRQHENLTSQLEHGARLLDLQIAYNQKNQQFYAAYTFSGDRLDEMLQQIADFLSAHSGEIIFLDLNPAWEYRNVTRDHYGEALDLVRQYLGDFLVDVNSGLNWSIADLVAANKRLVLVTENSADLISEENQYVINALRHKSNDLPIGQVAEIKALIQAEDRLVNVDVLHFTADLNPGTVILHPDIVATTEKFHNNLESLLDDYSKTSNLHIKGITVDHAGVGTMEKIIGYNWDDCWC